MSLFPAGMWQRLRGRGAVSPVAAPAQTADISFADLFGGPAQAIPQRVAPLPDLDDGLPAARPETDRAIMRAWAMRELARWRAAPVSREDAETSFAALNATDAELFVYRFESGRVDLAEKPEHLAINPITRDRVAKYLAFFSDVAKTLPQDFSTIIAMGMGDKVEFVPQMPVFAFQKRRGAVTILAPDVDFLNFGFYENADLADTTAYAQKTDRAIFVGGTTGGIVTPDIARRCALPRLRAAQYFRGHDRVDFLLPHIVQTSTAEAQQILEEMPFCRPGRLSWSQQLRYRFLISIDGNGATCSRVAIALRSNSVLLKYESEELLYYFHGLQPWLHYIPIFAEPDIERALDLDAWSPRALEEIAIRGRDFARRFLTRAAVTAYMAQLLQLYAACFADGTAPAPAPAPQGISALRPSAQVQVNLVAHIEGRGDTQADEDCWAGLASQPSRIEGFSVASSLPGWREQVSYQAILPDRSLGPLTKGGDYCGTYGQQQPIHGLIVHVAAGAPGTMLQNLVYEGVFGDGSRAGPCEPGMPCQSPSHAALVAMRVMIVDRAPAT